MVLLLFALVLVHPVLGFLLPDSCGDNVNCKLDSLIQITARQQSVIDQQSQKIAALENRLSVMSCRPMNAESEQLKVEANPNESELPTMDDCKTNGLTKGTETTIPSFYAIKSQDQRQLVKSERIIFETAVTNVFKAYDVYSGVFKVPLKGTYAFTWSIAMNNIDNHACFSLLVNDKIMGQTYLWNNGSDAMSTGFSVVEVNSGDDVFMSVCNVSQPLGEIISDIYRRTSFAGWCIACAG